MIFFTYCCCWLPIITQLTKLTKKFALDWKKDPILNKKRNFLVKLACIYKFRSHNIRMLVLHWTKTITSNTLFQYFSLHPMLTLVRLIDKLLLPAKSVATKKIVRNPIWWQQTLTRIWFSVHFLYWLSDLCNEYQPPPAIFNWEISQVQLPTRKWPLCCFPYHGMLHFYSNHHDSPIQYTCFTCSE